MTALENVAVPLELAGARDAFAARRSTSWRPSGLAQRLHHYPAELSGGEQQRVALARALAPNPAHPRRRRADRQSRRSDRRARSSSFCFAAIASAAPRSCWSPTTPRSPRVATAWCTCIRGGSTRRCRTRRNDRAGRYARRMAPSIGQRAQLAARFAWRELRGGLRGFGVFIACIALGVSRSPASVRWRRASPTASAAPGS